MCNENKDSEDYMPCDEEAIAAELRDLLEATPSPGFYDRVVYVDACGTLSHAGHIFIRMNGLGMRRLALGLLRAALGRPTESLDTKDVYFWKAGDGSVGASYTHGPLLVTITAWVTGQAIETAYYLAGMADKLDPAHAAPPSRPKKEEADDVPVPF